MKLISKTFDLILISVVFISFFIYFVSDSIDYFFKDRYFEGFKVVVPTTIFALINVPFLIILIFRKDYRSLKVIGLIVFAVFVLGFLGFKIPLTLLPILSGIGLFYIITELRKRIHSKRVSETD